MNLKDRIRKELDKLKPKPKPKPVKPSQPPKPPKPTTTPAVPGDRGSFVQCLNEQVGKGYKLGGKGPSVFDCSGLIAYCYNRVTGDYLVGDSHGQWLHLSPTNDPREGDLVFWDTGFSQRYGNKASHVAGIVEKGVVVNALNEQRGVVRSNINANYGGPLLGYRRLFS